MRVSDAAVKHMLELEKALGSSFALCRNAFLVGMQANWQVQGSFEEVLVQQDLQVDFHRQLDKGAALLEADAAAGSRCQAEAAVYFFGSLFAGTCNSGEDAGR